MTGFFKALHTLVKALNCYCLSLATWCKEPAHWKRSWCWERLRAGGEGVDRRWDGWMASLTQTWVWASSGSWWWTGKPGVLQSMGLNWTRLSNWTTTNCSYLIKSWFCDPFSIPISVRFFSSWWEKCKGTHPRLLMWDRHWNMCLNLLTHFISTETNRGYVLYHFANITNQDIESQANRPHQIIQLPVQD